MRTTMTALRADDWPQVTASPPPDVRQLAVSAHHRPLAWFPAPVRLPAAIASASLAPPMSVHPAPISLRAATTAYAPQLARSRGRPGVASHGLMRCRSPAPAAVSLRVATHACRACSFAPRLNVVLSPGTGHRRSLCSTSPDLWASRTLARSERSSRLPRHIWP